MIGKIYFANPYKAVRFATKKARLVRQIAKGKVNPDENAQFSEFKKDEVRHFQELAKNYSNNIFKRIKNWFKFFKANIKSQVDEKKGLEFIDKAGSPEVKRTVPAQEVKFN